MPPRTMAKAQFAVIFGERFIKAMAAWFYRPPTHGIPDSPVETAKAQPSARRSAPPGPDSCSCHPTYRT